MPWEILLGCLSIAMSRTGAQGDWGIFVLLVYVANVGLASHALLQMYQYVCVAVVEGFIGFQLPFPCGGWS